MDKVTQQATATAEEMASASEEMSAQAAQMKESVYRLSAIVGRVNSTASPGENFPANGKAGVLLATG